MATLHRFDTNHRGQSGKTHSHWTYTCSCGKRAGGNAAKASHRKACDGYYLSTSEENALRKAAWEQWDGSQ